MYICSRSSAMHTKPWRALWCCFVSLSTNSVIYWISISRGSHKWRCSTLYRNMTPCLSQKYLWTTDLSMHIQRPSFWSCFMRGSRLSLYSGMLRYSSRMTTTIIPPEDNKEKDVWYKTLAMSPQFSLNNQERDVWYKHIAMPQQPYKAQTKRDKNQINSWYIT